MAVGKTGYIVMVGFVRRPAWYALPAFVVWTLLVWATRIDNIWSDPALTDSGKWARTALAVSFVVAALAVAIVAVRTWRQPPTRIDGAVLDVAAFWTLAVWAVRAVQIALGDHSVGFIVVHLLLAVVSIALAWWLARAHRYDPERHGTANQRS